MKSINMKLIASAAMLLVATSPTSAITVTWDGGGDGTVWNDDVNWSADVKPGLNDTARLYWLNKPSDKTISIGAPQAFSLLSFDGNPPNNLYVGTTADALAGNSLSFSSVYRSTTLSGLQYVDANVFLPDSSIWEINNGYNGSLTVRGSISGAAEKFIKIGNGTLALNGDNTIDGDIYINSGTLAMGHTNALGASGTIFLNGGVLGVFGPRDISSRFSPLTHNYDLDTMGTNVSFATPLTGETGQLVKRGAGTLTLTVPNTYGGPTTIYKGTLTFSGSGSLGSTTAPLTLGADDSSTLDIASASPLTVGEVLFLNMGGNAGRIKNGTLTGTRYSAYLSGNAYIDATLAGTGIELVKGGSGTLYMYKSNEYTGDTTVNVGTLRVDFNNASSATSNMIHQTSSLVMGGGTLYLNNSYNSGGNRYQKLDAIRVEKGASKFTMDMNNSRSTRLEFSAMSRTNGATLNIAQPTGNTAINANNGYVSSASIDATGLLGGGYLTVNGADWAANNGINIVAYTGYDTVSGEAAIIPDSATANVQIDSSTTGTVTLASSTTTVNTLKSSDAATRTLDLGGGTLRLGIIGGLLTPTTSGPLTINNGTLTAGGEDNAAGEVVFHNAKSVTNSAVIADNGSGRVSLVKSGDGTLTLLSQQTYTGDTFVNAGTLLLSPGTDRLVPSGNILVNGGTLDLGTSSNNISGSVIFRGGTTSNGRIVKSVSDFDALGGTVSAVLGGSVGLVKTSRESLTLSGANTYTGDTVVKEGAVTINNAIKGNLIVGELNGTVPASVSCVNTPLNKDKNWIVYPNGSLSLGSSAQWVQSKITIIGGSVSGSQPYFQAGSSVEMTGGNLSVNAYTTAFPITTLACDKPAVFSGTLRFSHTLTIADGSAAHDMIFSGAHGGTGLTKNGAGTLVMIGFGKSYTGTTAVNAGTLLVDNPPQSSGTGNSTVSVAKGATLGGTGYIGGLPSYSSANVSLTGESGNVATLAPGTINSISGDPIIGTLTVGGFDQTNNVTFGAYSTLKINFDTTGHCDKLVVNGTLSLNATTDTLWLNISDYDALKPGTYTLATFKQLATPATVFDLLDVPSHGTLVYTDTSIEFTVHPKGTVFLIR